jgi:cell division protein ZapA
MSSVNITINEKQYRVACEPGQEQRVTQLAKDFDERIAGMRSRFGEVGDARLTVMAAMMIGDELLDARAKVARLEAEIGALQAARAGASDRASRTESAVVGALEAAADRIERMTLALSRPAGGGMAVG